MEASTPSIADKIVEKSALGDIGRWSSQAQERRWKEEILSQIHIVAKQLEMEPSQVLSALAEIVDGGGACLALSELELESTTQTSELELDEIDSLLAGAYRHGAGAYMTPAEAAEGLVDLLPNLLPGPIIDPACGHGEFLLAMRRRWPRRDLVGVESHPGLAMAAALRLFRYDRLQGKGSTGKITIYVGDGLSRPNDSAFGAGSFAAVVGNPPYLGEKGQAAFFRALRSAYPRFDDIFSARMDLIYPFLARGTELVKPGGWNAWLTPPYWLSADGARGLRRLLSEAMIPEIFVMLDSPDLFRACPGEELLFSLLRRPLVAPEEDALQSVSGPRWWKGTLKDLKAATERAEEQGSFGQPVSPELLRDSGWHPFTPPSVALWRQKLMESGSPLGELGRDFQGFVSGADRVTRRHLSMLDSSEVEKGEPIFLVDGDPIPEHWRELTPKLIRPLIRRRHTAANKVIRQPPGDAWALYIDDRACEEYDEPTFERLLGRFRPVLERRREVGRGLMPWYRLHWPRDRSAMEEPKLVVPRRAAQPQFSLDLSGSMISSDCTFILAPAGTVDPVRYLGALMLLLNNERTDRYLRYFGKMKGQIMEFYSTPLRNIVVAASQVDGMLHLDEEIFDAGERRDFDARLEEVLHS